LYQGMLCADPMSELLNFVLLKSWPTDYLGTLDLSICYPFNHMKITAKDKFRFFPKIHQH
jgi:hypothetical protein